MSDQKPEQEQSQFREFERIFTTSLPEIEKLKQGFFWITNQIIRNSQNEMELYKALNDHESLVKEQIKSSIIQHAQNIFEECYRRARQTGRQE